MKIDVTLCCNKLLMEYEFLLLIVINKIYSFLFFLFALPFMLLGYLNNKRGFNSLGSFVGGSVMLTRQLWIEFFL